MSGKDRGLWLPGSSQSSSDLALCLLHNLTWALPAAGAGAGGA